MNTTQVKTPRILFAITSTGRDQYTAMTRIAIASIRITNPNIQVTIACDPETAANLKASDDPIVHEADGLLVIDSPAGEPGFRNRWVKTTLRLNTSGPFLFLDSDVLVRGDLSPIFETQADIAGARNHSLSSLQAQIWREDRSVLDAMGWQTSSDVYINGGVLFYNETPKALEFARDWHAKWKEAYSLNKRFRDQPALNASLYKNPIELHVLENRYNCQFASNMQCLPNAIIWHYYSSVQDRPSTKFDLLCRQLMSGYILKPESISRMIRCQHPWRSENFLDHLAANRIMHRNRFDGWEKEILMRNYRYFLPKMFYRGLFEK